jgi:hypothetical protein
MTSADRNDLMPAQEQEKLEWVTPKISLMEAGETDSIQSKYKSKSVRNYLNSIWSSYFTTTNLIDR